MVIMTMVMQMVMMMMPTMMMQVMMMTPIRTGYEADEKLEGEPGHVYSLQNFNCFVGI